MLNKSEELPNIWAADPRHRATGNKSAVVLVFYRDHKILTSNSLFPPNLKIQVLIPIVWCFWCCFWAFL